MTDPGFSYPFHAHPGFRKTGFADGFCRFALDLGPHPANRVGLPHGGVHAALLDSALGGSGCWMGNATDIRPAVTLSLTIAFLAPPRGGRLIGACRRTGGGASVCFAEGAVRDDIGTRVATAIGTFRIMRPAE